MVMKKMMMMIIFNFCSDIQSDKDEKMLIYMLIACILEM